VPVVSTVPTPDNAEPSPTNLDAVISPDALMSPVTSNSATNPDVLLIPNPFMF
jgi:hypothetical protein